MIQFIISFASLMLPATGGPARSRKRPTWQGQLHTAGRAPLHFAARERAGQGCLFTGLHISTTTTLVRNLRTMYLSTLLDLFISLRCEVHLDIDISCLKHYLQSILTLKFESLFVTQRNMNICQNLIHSKLHVLMMILK